MSNTRRIAAHIISRFLKEKIALNRILFAEVPSGIDVRDRAFIQELCYGVIRWYFPLKKLSSFLLKKSLNCLDQDIYALVLVGLYQLNYLNISPHAAVYETVQAAKELRKRWAAPLINGVLRSFQREKTVLLKKVSQITHLAHPDWLIKKLQHAWPNAWRSILDANNHLASMSLRVNQLEITRESYLQKLNNNNINATLSELSQSGIILDTSFPVDKLPGFRTGEISIQNISAQLSASLLLLEDGQHVLDACAAPGGKTTHILETQPELACCVAVDADVVRLTRLKNNLKRLKLTDKKIQLFPMKVQDFKIFWKGRMFDRILLDSPCSGTGVIRKHPDIKLLRREKDVIQLADQQYQLLSSLWGLLKPGGILLYVTCSVLPEENANVLKRFLTYHFDAREEIIRETWGLACPIGRQILPEIHGADGFYYARLRKLMRERIGLK